MDAQMNAAKKFEPAVSRKTLVNVAGTFWLIGGLAVLTRAYFMLDTITFTGAGLLFLGLVVGSLKSHFVLSKVAGKNIERIKNLSPHKEKVCIFAFQVPLSYFLVALMIMTGVALRAYLGSSIYLAALYVGIGAALIVSGMQYFMRASAVSDSD
jgi:hypothetical protein